MEAAGEPTSALRSQPPSAGASQRAFRSIPGAVFPLYHVLADVGEFAASQVVPTRSSDPLRVDGLALRGGDKGGAARVVLANLSPEPQRVTVRGLGARVRVRLLDETNALAAMTAPEDFRAEVGEETETDGGALELELLPYAVARIDTEPLNPLNPH
jgi:hypothetical protein